MKRISWMTPSEHRLALLLLVLALLGAGAKGLKQLDPEIEAWLLEPLPLVEPVEETEPEPEPEAPPGPVDPNTATDVELDTLPGIGPALAIRIIQHRPYQSLQDLVRVPGIGAATLEKMKPRLEFADSGGVGHSPQGP